MKPTPMPQGVETVSQWSDKLLAVPFEALLFRRDRAIRCGDIEEALACAIAIDKKRGIHSAPHPSIPAPIRRKRNQP
ncbi:MAG: hypothetical protein HS113_29235 [Verrucomicrobiales bacterium]|nr:hypothetical protein [Verrucomicrobiales bacterium]